MLKKITVVLMFALCLNTMGQSLVVFNGADKKSGKSWSAPKDTVTFTVSSAQPFKDKDTLELKAEWSNWWAGGGWNWFSWYGEGNDISQYKSLSFYLKKTSGNLKDFNLMLVDAKNMKSKELNIIESGCITSIGPEYTKVTIPLDKFSGDFARNAIWGIDFGIKPATQLGECTLYIAQIEFEKEVSELQALNNK